MIILPHLHVRIGARPHDSRKRSEAGLRFVFFSNTLGYKNFIVFVISGHRRARMERLLK